MHVGTQTLTFWLRDDFGSLRRSSGSRLTFILCDDAKAATDDDADATTAAVDSDDDDEDDVDDDDDDAAAAVAVAAAALFAAPTADDGCEPSNRPCISFGNRPDTSRGVVCPLSFVVVGALLRTDKSHIHTHTHIRKGNIINIIIIKCIVVALSVHVARRSELSKHHLYCARTYSTLRARAM